MKKQTAVEWLVKIYLQTGKIDSFDINQAKAMEKDQIIDACNYGDFEELGEKYYTETYGK
jgi:dihydroneopterin aldolase